MAIASRGDVYERDRGSAWTEPTGGGETRDELQSKNAVGDA